jgi:hypothetical protein
MLHPFQVLIPPKYPSFAFFRNLGLRSVDCLSNRPTQVLVTLKAPLVPNRSIGSLENPIQGFQRSGYLFQADSGGA